MIRVACAAVIVSIALSSAPASAGLLLARGGRSVYTIAVSPQASPSERHAAEELGMFLKKISGADFPVSTEAAKGPMILLGDSPALAALRLDIPWAELGDEGFVIRTVGPHLVLAGGRLRGSMYAVYTLLEDYLGCRWLSSKVSYIPVHWKWLRAP